MKKIKQFLIKILKSIEDAQMAKARRIVANTQAGMRSWE